MNRIERLPIDSDLLQTFAAIAECGNLTVAAGRLGRTQSAISVQLRKLEDGLEASLFVRGARGMTLTPAGEALLSRAKSILVDIKEAADLFLEPPTGVVHVGFPDDFDERVLERILLEFSNTYPGIQVVARSGCTARYPDAIRSGDLDVAVCSGLKDLGGQSLYIEPIVWASRAGVRWPRDAPVPLAILDRQCYWRDLPIEALNRAGWTYRVAFQSSSFTSLQAALRAGSAVGLLPRSSVGDGLEVLTAAEGFPELPVSRRSILRSASGLKQISDAMVEAIRNAHPK